MADMGMDIDDVWAQLEKEQIDAETKGLFLEAISSSKATKDVVKQTTKSLEDKLDTLERGIETIKSIPQPSPVVPNITVQAPEITLSPMVKMPGTVTIRKAVRDDRGLIDHFIDVEELETNKEQKNDN